MTLDLQDPDELLAAILQGSKKGSTRDRNRYAKAIRARLTMSALTLGDWVGLGDHIESRFIEQTLLQHGLGIFYMQPAGEVADSNGDGILEEPRFTFKQAAASGDLSDQWVSTRYTAISPGGPNRIIHTKGSLEKWGGVPVYSNTAAQIGYLKYVKDTISFYSNRIADAMLTVDVNLSNTRVQRVAAVDKKQVKGAQQISDLIDAGNGIALFDPSTGKSIDEIISVLDFGVDPQSVETVHGVFVRILGEAYNAIGIQAEQNEKSAQQNVVELQSDDSMVMAIRKSMIDSRKWAADKINKRYGLEVEFIDSGTGRNTDPNRNNNDLNHSESTDSNKSVFRGLFR